MLLGVTIQKVTMDISTRFKMVRESLGHSQREMAKYLHSSLGALQSYESGKSIPGGNVLETLARLGFNVNWILTGEGEMKRAGGQNKPVVKSDSNEEVSEYSKQFLLRVIESILESKNFSGGSIGYDPYLLSTKEFAVLVYIMYAFFSRPGALIGKGNMSIHSSMFARMIIDRQHNRQKTSKNVQEQLVNNLQGALDFSGTGSDFLSFPIDIINDLFKDEGVDEQFELQLNECEKIQGNAKEGE